LTDTQGDGVPDPHEPDAKRQARRRAVAHYVPIVGWLPRYDRGDLRFDAIAGIVSWGVMVPVAMAYAGLAGMPPETGLVTAFAALAAYAVFGTSRHLKVTASSSVAILSASVVGAIISSRDPASYVALSAGLALVVGVILVVAGAARLGFLSQFLALSVVTGFVIGLAITITIGQLPGLLGIPAVAGTTLERLVGMGQEVLKLTDPITAVLGVGSLVGILLLKRIAPRIPGPLIALIVVIFDLFPAEVVGVAAGVAIGLFGGLGGVTGPLVLGYSYDHTQSFFWGFCGMSAGAVVGSLALIPVMFYEHRVKKAKATATISQPAFSMPLRESS
jgi:MFS superfamily sulfate permease-like transporter